MDIFSCWNLIWCIVLNFFIMPFKWNENHWPKNITYFYHFSRSTSKDSESTKNHPQSVGSDIPKLITKASYKVLDNDVKTAWINPRLLSKVINCFSDVRIPIKVFNFLHVVSFSKQEKNTKPGLIKTVFLVASHSNDLESVNQAF